MKLAYTTRWIRPRGFPGGGGNRELHVRCGLRAVQGRAYASGRNHAMDVCGLAPSPTGNGMQCNGKSAAIYRRRHEPGSVRPENNECGVAGERGCRQA
jgi:hypothetical protein